jgi:general nucleoside transport system permease protein
MNDERRAEQNTAEQATKLGPPPEPTAAPGRGLPRLDQAGSAIITAVVQGSPAVVTALSIFTALVVGAVLIAVTDPVVLRAWDSLGYAPGAAFSATWNSAAAAYSALWEGSIFNPATVGAAFHGGSIAAIFYPISLTIFQATPLILTGLSVAIAFRSGLFNIGAAGQFTGGAIVAAWLAAYLSMPPGISILVCVIGAIIGGALVGGTAGLLKARTGAHEVIVTIMLNYIMASFLLYLLNSHNLLQAPGAPNPIAAPIASNTILPHVGGPPPQANLGFLLAIAAAAGVAWLLSRSTTGFEFRTVGANPSAARSAGMNVEWTWVRVMLIAGALAGLAAAIVIMSSPPTQLVTSTVGNYGFDGITVALLGRAKPLGVVLAGLLFGALYAGGTNVAASTSVPTDIVLVLEGLIVLFVAAPPLIRAIYRLRGAAGTGMEEFAKGWNG